MSETIKLCAMLVRHVFAPDDEARDEEMRRPFVEQAMRAKREHDEMRRELAEARGRVESAHGALHRAELRELAALAELDEARATIEAADTTRREWEVRAAKSRKEADALRGERHDLTNEVMTLKSLLHVALRTTGQLPPGKDLPTDKTARTRLLNTLILDALPLLLDERYRTAHATGRAAGLREGFDIARDHAWISTHDGWNHTAPCIDWEHAEKRLALALAQPAAETVRTETIFGCRTCPASTPGWTDGRFASPGWGRIDHIDGPNAICPVCAADPTSLDCLREEYPDVTPAAEPRDEGEVSDE